MRSSEQLVTARWEDVDWERRVLRLREAKAGRRRVPLGPEAIDILQSLRQVVRETDAWLYLLFVDSQYLANAMPGPTTTETTIFSEA